MKRRDFLKILGLSTLATQVPFTAIAQSESNPVYDNHVHPVHDPLGRDIPTARPFISYNVNVDGVNYRMTLEHGGNADFLQQQNDGSYTLNREGVNMFLESIDGVEEVIKDNGVDGVVDRVEFRGARPGLVRGTAYSDNVQMSVEQISHYDTIAQNAIGQLESKLESGQIIDRVH